MQGLDNLRKRLSFMGGNQQGRMDKSKYDTYKTALHCSYHSEDIVFNNTTYRCLMNPNKVTQSYDDKIISIDNSAGMTSGQVFRWTDTATDWICYSQNKEESVYFMGKVRRCRYIISFLLGGEVHTTLAAVIGPNEDTINNSHSSDISIDTPSETSTILIPKNEETIAYFKVYSTIMLDGLSWQVQTVNGIGIDGVLEVNIRKYYKDEFKDTDTTTNLLLVETEEASEIVGEPLMKMYETYTYTDSISAEWEISTTNNVSISAKTNQSITLVALKTGKFTLKHGDNTKNVRVDSLF